MDGIQDAVSFALDLARTSVSKLMLAHTAPSFTLKSEMICHG